MKDFYHIEIEKKIIESLKKIENNKLSISSTKNHNIGDVILLFEKQNFALIEIKKKLGASI